MIDFTERDAERCAREVWGLEAKAHPLAGEFDRNFRLEAHDGERFVLKASAEARDVLELQNAVLTRLAERVPGLCPQLVPTRAADAIADVDGLSVRLLTWLEGDLLAETPRTPELRFRLGEALGRIDRALEGFEHPAMDRLLRWDLRQAAWTIGESGAIADPVRRAIVERLQVQFLALRRRLDALPTSVIHGDANDYNVLVRKGRVAGLLDFGDVVRTCRVCEPAIAAAYAMLDQEDPVAAAQEILEGYESMVPLLAAERAVYLPLAAIRLCVSVVTSALEVRKDEYHRIHEEAAWETLARLRESDPPTDALRARRRRLLGGSLSLAYERPLEIVRGEMQYLFDRRGRGYLDGVNNVCHVGHCHPHVVAAAAKQMAELNTNTRYLHENVLRYAERLTALLPAPLSVCFFVNSGSEANELAIRMARAFTGRRAFVVMDGAYYGNTSSLVDLSPYKHEGPGGAGPPPWVRKVPVPDRYRRRDVGDFGAEAAQAAADDVAAFFCESIPSCPGHIVLPPGYLAAAYEAFRARGAVCVADEVQVGFGRVGTHVWAFETQGVVPDIVTLGKPIGNGHPLGAVVTTPEIAAAFDNGMEYFNTFGGNPVSCAVGLAVLDVIEDEDLRGRALRVGRTLHSGFEHLAERHAVIGDVRGLGLFVGVEFVKDRTTLEPAPDLLRGLVEKMRDAGFLLSTEGPHGNVLKLKPPLQIMEEDAVLLLTVLDRVLDAHRA